MILFLQIDPETRPAALGPPFTGHFRVLVDTPRGLQPLHPGSSKPEEVSSDSKEKAKEGAEASSTSKVNPLGLELRKTIYHTTSSTLNPVSNSLASTLAETSDNALKSSQSHSDGKPGEALSYSCDTCATDCTKTRFHSVRHKNFQLCGGCFSEGRFPTSMYSGDFVRVDERVLNSANGAAVEEDHDWNDIETLKLLEGLELFDEDWGKISEHVGTRSREECITRFLQMPIEDKWLEETNPNSSSSSKINGLETQGQLGPLSILANASNGLTPFDKADNPVMSVVAFLASNVSPAVAAAAAKRAIGEIGKGVKKRAEENEKERKRGEENGKEVEGEEATGDKKDKDAMDVDDAEVEGEGEKEKEKETEVEESNENKDSLPPMASLASLALGAAAAKAHVLSAFEERECQSLVAQCVSAQMKKLEVSKNLFLCESTR